MTEQWAHLSLGELTETTRPICYGVLKPGPYVAGGVPLIRIQDMEGDRLEADGHHLISDDLDEEFKRSRLSGGEVLLSIQGTVGRVALCPPELAGANISRTVAVIEPDARLTPQFLRLYLQLVADSEGFDDTGSTRASLNISTIRAMQVPVPPLPVQRRIVDLLTHLDAHIANLKAEEASLSIALALLRAELLRDGESVPLADLAAPGGIQIGPFGSQLHANEYTAEGTPVVMPRDLAGGVVQTENLKRVPSEVAKRLHRHRLQPGDIVFPRRGDLSKRALILEGQEGWLCGTGCIRFRPNKHTDSGQVFQSISGDAATQWLVEHAVGTTMLNLNTQIVGSLPVVVPTETTAPIAESARALVEVAEGLSEESSRLGTLRNALLAEVLSGRVEVDSAVDTLVVAS